MQNIQKLAANFATQQSKNKYFKICSQNCTSFKVNEVKKEVAWIIKTRHLRAEHKVKLPTVRQQIWNRYEDKVNAIAALLPNADYSMGQYNSVHIRLTELKGRWNNAEDYSRSSKYKAVHGGMHLNLSAKDFLKSQIIGGLITIFGDKIGKDLFACKWVTGQGSKSHCHIVMVDGFIYKDYHFIAIDITSAKEFAKKRKVTLLAAEICKNAEAKIQKMIDKMPMNRIFVEVTDSTIGGNCLPGTENFARKIGVNLSVTGAVRADFIYQNRNGYEPFVLKAINAAKIRYSNLGILN